MIISSVSYQYCHKSLLHYEFSVPCKSSCNQVSEALLPSKRVGFLPPSFDPNKFPLSYGNIVYKEGRLRFFLVQYLVYFDLGISIVGGL